MLIKDLARAAGITPQVVRFYARAGLISPSERHENGYRSFVMTDVERLKFIVSAKQFGFTLQEVRELLSAPDAGTAACCDSLKAGLERRLSELRDRVAEIEAIGSRIEARLESWRGSGCDEEAITSCPKLAARTGQGSPVQPVVIRRVRRRPGPVHREPLSCKADPCNATTCEC